MPRLEVRIVDSEPKTAWELVMPSAGVSGYGVTLKAAAEMFGRRMERLASQEAERILCEIADEKAEP